MNVHWVVGIILWLLCGFATAVWITVEEGYLRVEDLGVVLFCLAIWPFFLVWQATDKWGKVYIWRSKR